jgi:uncharacterized protein YceK
MGYLMGMRLHRRCRLRAAALPLLALVLSASPGCQSLRSWDQSCPGVYSGARFFGDQIGELPWDGKIFFSLDLPLTLVVDTLSLPVTAFAERRRPPMGWVVGCRWAAKR